MLCCDLLDLDRCFGGPLQRIQLPWGMSAVNQYYQSPISTKKKEEKKKRKKDNNKLIIEAKNNQSII